MSGQYSQEPRSFTEVSYAAPSGVCVDVPRRAVSNRTVRPHGRLLGYHGLIIEVQSEPTYDFARAANQIGFETWSERFKRRGDSQVRRVFDPQSPERIQHLLDRMNRAAEVGTFAGVLAVDHSGLTTAEVGYAWAADDVSGNPLARAVKAALRRKPYAWVAQINVLPMRQGHGIGAALLHQALTQFEPDQKPTAYVFEENKKSMAWFRERIGGFEYVPAEVDPEHDITTKYFGTNNPPVTQRRLQAPSVEATIQRAAAHEAPHQVLHAVFS